MSGAESLFAGDHGEAGEEVSPGDELAVVEEEVAKNGEIFLSSGSADTLQETEAPVERPLNTAQKRKKMKKAIANAQNRVSYTDAPSHEKTKSAGERHAEWIDAKTLAVIEYKLGSRIDHLAKRLKRSGRLDDEKPELQKFRIARTDKNAALFDLLDREDYLIMEDKEGDEVHYLDPTGYIAANILIDSSLSDSDKYLLIGGSRRLAGTFIINRLGQIKQRDNAK
jgi:hypothetical protein